MYLKRNMVEDAQYVCVWGGGGAGGGGCRARRVAGEEGYVLRLKFLRGWAGVRGTFFSHGRPCRLGVC